jgi:hypothetical protein
MVAERESFLTANATGIINYVFESDLTQNNLYIYIYIQMWRNALYVLYWLFTLKFVTWKSELSAHHISLKI